MLKIRIITYQIIFLLNSSGAVNFGLTSRYKIGKVKRAIADAANAIGRRETGDTLKLTKPAFKEGGLPQVAGDISKLQQQQTKDLSIKITGPKSIQDIYFGVPTKRKPYTKEELNRFFGVDFEKILP